jgi:hypothetical protein
MISIIPIEGAKLTENSLILPEGMAYPEWEAAGEKLRMIHGASSFWVGDWLNFGERKFGEMYTQAIETTGKDYGTLANYKYVTSRINPSRRRENLSFAHHAEVAVFEPAEQDKWLNLAVTESLSRNELRLMIHKEHPDGMKDRILATIHKLIQELLDFEPKHTSTRVEVKFNIDTLNRLIGAIESDTKNG